MNKNTWIIIGVVALLVIVGGVYSSMNKKVSTMTDKKMDDSVIIQKENDTMIKDDAMKTNEMVEKEEMSTSDKNDVVMKGSYELYSPEKLARAEAGDVVLFFHASWCPSCRSLSSDIESNIGSIPEGVSILKVDYDKETELKKKYGITYQHTLVQVDKDGTLIKKWSGSPKLSNLVLEIQ